MLSPSQCRAARGLIGHTQAQLAKRAGIGLSRLRNFETGRLAVPAEIVAKICAALEAAGVQFIAENGGGEGVRLKAPNRRRGR
ncbi:MAG: transcriptional regulator [Hyphomicrobium sp.]|nr:MAG: transcriptional regulator [Hyphomicrobium sp.]